MSLSATRHRAAVVVSVLVALTALTGCGAGPRSGSGDRIAAAFYPLAFVAGRVAGDHYEVVNLTHPGQEPHDLELGPKQVADIAGADVVVIEHGLQPAVDAAAEQNAEGSVLDIADVVHLKPFAGKNELDPHFWHDPRLMATYGDALAARLAKVDPDHAADYRANAASLRADLTQLDQELTSGLAHCKRDTIVVNHDAFGYLARYGLHIEPIVGLSPDAEPTAGTLSRLQALIRREHLTTVFSETLVSPKTAKTLAHDLGIRAEVLDPIEGLTDATKNEDYLSLMRSNLAKLKAANACG